MTQDWKTFLQANGAEFENEQLVSFGNIDLERRAAVGGDVMCDLTQSYSLLAIQGEDARTFLQGQLTNDIEKLSPLQSQLTGFCNPKGRLIANFRLIQNGDTIFAIIPQDMFDATLQQLQKYVVRAQVVMGNASDALAHIGASGDKAAEQLQSHLGALPENLHDVLQHDKFLTIKVGDFRYQVFGALDDCKALWQHLDVQCAAVGAQHWQLLNIRDGIPEITAPVSEAFVPQMVNMDLIGAVSFDKGCYTGQEIIARTHYLGKQKRRMFRIKLLCDAQPKVADELATDTSTENQYTGTLVTAQPAIDNGYEALAVIQIQAAENETLRLKGVESEIEILPLPYKVTAE